MKRLLAILLCLALCVSLIPAAFAGEIEIFDELEALPEEEITLVDPADGTNDVVASGECGDNLTWELDDQGTLTISGTGEMWNYSYNLYSGINAPWSSVRQEIRSTVIGDGVTHIGNCIFGFCVNMTDVTIPNSVTSIGSGAFMQCRGLTNIILPMGLVSLEEDSFRECSLLTRVSIPEGVKSIGARAFLRCGVSDVHIPNSVSYIGESAFSRCSNLSTIVFPISVSYIGEYCFGDCSELNEIHFEGAAPTFVENCFRNVTATAYYPANDPSWTNDVMQDYGGTLTWVSYPGGQCGDNVYWTLDEGGSLRIYGSGDMWDYTVSNHPEWHDYAGRIKSVVIEEGVTCVGENAFYDPGKYKLLTSVSIPEGVTHLRNGAFSCCSALTTITLPESLISIGDGCFTQCVALTAINLPDNLVDIGWGSFSSCDSLKRIEIPSKVTILADYVFGSCISLEEVSLPGEVTSIGTSAFNCCYALKSIVLPDSLKTIKNWSFGYCKALTEITFPNSLESIDYYAFLGCETLSKITFTGSAPTFGEDCFKNVTATAYYPCNNSSWWNSQHDYGGSITWVISHDYHDTVTEPTCTAGGYTTHICSRCQDTCVDSFTDALGHDYHDTVTEPTCTEQGYTTHTCIRCEDTYVDSYTDALGHDYHDTVTEPTCTEKGYTSHECSRCHDSYIDSYTDPLGHEFGDPEWNWSDDYSAATATFSCERGDDSETLDAEISMTVASTRTIVTGKVRFNNKLYVDTKTIQLSINHTKLDIPVFDYAILELNVNNGVAAKAEWSSSNPAVATVDSDGIVTALKYGKTTITGSAYGLSLSCEVQTLFWDVTGSPMSSDPNYQYFYKPVYWAAEKGITVGYSDGSFGVGKNCERRELMIFLWRYAGEPTKDKNGNPYGDARKMFSDLNAYGPNSATNKAIAWACTEGITKGYTDGTFHPTDPIVRKDVMILLYRLAGKPAVSGTLTFPDCQAYSKTSDTYKAILWGSQNGITNGYTSGEYAGQFGVNLNCLREQIVTFLSRYDEKILHHPHSS